MPKNPPPADAQTRAEAMLRAAVDLLLRTGAEEFQLRYTDDDVPLVWFAAARWADHWEVGAAVNPLDAAFRLCDQVIDGGTCQHCHRATGFAPELDTMPLDKFVCWYQFDPELATFRRGCE